VTSPLLESLASAFSGDAARRALLDAALRDGLPGPRTEAWKYTHLRQLERRAFSPASTLPGVDPAALAAIPAPRLVFVNGLYAPALSDTAGLPEGVSLRPLSADDIATRISGDRYGRPEEVFARLNAALASEGALLHANASIRGGTCTTWSNWRKVPAWRWSSTISPPRRTPVWPTSSPGSGWPPARNLRTRASRAKANARPCCIGPTPCWPATRSTAAPTSNSAARCHGMN
jgi:hypothetical protein